MQEDRQSIGATESRRDSVGPGSNQAKLRAY